MAIFVKVVRASRTEKGIIIHELDNGEKKMYVAVRGGLAWPLTIEKAFPAYCCVVAEELIEAAQRKEGLRGRLIFLSEYEAPDILSLSELFTKLTDDVKLFDCNIFYTLTQKNQNKDYSGQTEAFRKFAYEKQIGVHLEEAPLADDPELGLSYIREWMKKGLLDLPEESLVRNQLRMMEEEKVNRSPKMFNAVNALRFVVCGFEKYVPNPTEKNWRDRTKRGTWMSA